jgi:hypothetical protein
LDRVGGVEDEDEEVVLCGRHDQYCFYMRREASRERKEEGEATGKALGRST